MGKAEVAPELELQVSDVSGQKVFNVKNAPVANTVGQLISEMIPILNLPRNDNSGAPLTYMARSERTGTHLNASERLGDTLEPGDRLTLAPNIDAGVI